MLVFQHNNVRAVEWTALRREVAIALNKLSPGADLDPVAQGIKITMLQGAIFSAAMRVAEYYDPSNGSLHGTSKEAYELTKKRKKHPIAPIITGPVGIVTFPVASPEYLKTVMAVMFPESGRAARGMDPLAASGLQKLVLLTARVDGHVAAGKVGAGQVMEVGKVKWLSTLPELEGLRGQLVAIFQRIGGGDLARSLEAIPTGVVRTLDAHRKVLNGELEQDG
jgi:large subunit ribosomal protein L10